MRKAYRKFATPEEREAARREDYKRRYAKMKAGGFAYRKHHRYSLYRTLTELKTGKPCMDCGVAYPSYVMEYDHRDPSQKVERVTRLAQLGSLKKMLAEIEKCDLVCANCHRIRTFARKPMKHIAYFANAGTDAGTACNDNEKKLNDTDA